jgi:hypothetical protein
MENRLNFVYWKVRGIPFISVLFGKTSPQVMPSDGKSWALFPCPQKSADKEGVTFTRTTVYLIVETNLEILFRSKIV